MGLNNYPISTFTKSRSGTQIVSRIGNVVHARRMHTQPILEYDMRQDQLITSQMIASGSPPDVFEGSRTDGAVTFTPPNESSESVRFVGFGVLIAHGRSHTCASRMRKIRGI
jgi:hypothetical protein